MLQPSSLCYAVPSLKRLHFYEARLSAYEAFCGIAAKYEAPQMRYEAKPFQASYFFAQNLGKKMGCKILFPHLIFTGESSKLFYPNGNKS